MNKVSNRAIGLGFAGVGGILVVISMLLPDGYWFLLTGSAFVLVGLVRYFLGRQDTSKAENTQENDR